MMMAAAEGVKVEVDDEWMRGGEDWEGRGAADQLTE